MANIELIITTPSRTGNDIGFDVVAKITDNRNPVPDGTAVIFNANGRKVAEQLTDNGRASTGITMDATRLLGRQILIEATVGNDSAAKFIDIPHEPKALTAANEWNYHVNPIGNGRYRLNLDVTGENRLGVKGVLVSVEEEGSAWQKEQETNERGVIDPPIILEVPKGEWRRFLVKAHGTQLDTQEPLQLKGASIVSPTFSTTISKLLVSVLLGLLVFNFAVFGVFDWGGEVTTETAAQYPEPDKYTGAFNSSYGEFIRELRAEQKQKRGEETSGDSTITTKPSYWGIFGAKLRAFLTSGWFWLLLAVATLANLFYTLRTVWIKLRESVEWRLWARTSGKQDLPDTNADVAKSAADYAAQGISPGGRPLTFWKYFVTEGFLNGITELWEAYLHKRMK